MGRWLQDGLTQTGRPAAAPTPAATTVHVQVFLKGWNWRQIPSTAKQGRVNCLELSIADNVLRF